MPTAETQNTSTTHGRTHEQYNTWEIGFRWGLELRKQIGSDESDGDYPGEHADYDPGEHAGYEQGEHAGYEQGEHAGYDPGEHAGYEQGDHAGYDPGETYFV